MKRKEIRVRCWIDIDGEKFFGPGRANLLELIRESGSIVKAARIMGMSYKKAWDMVEQMNRRGQKPYVVTHKGGKKGGGTELTETGKRVITSYRRLIDKVRVLVDKETELLRLI